MRLAITLGWKADGTIEVISLPSVDHESQRKAIGLHKANNTCFHGYAKAEMWPSERGEPIVVCIAPEGEPSTKREKAPQMKSNKLKSAFAGLAAMLFMVASLPAIDIYAPQNVIGGGTNNVIKVATNTYSLTLDVRKQNDVGIQISAYSIATNQVIAQADFVGSVDGTYWDLTRLLSVTFIRTTNGNTGGFATVATNLPVEGLGYLKLYKLKNWETNGILTNIYVKYSIKR